MARRATGGTLLAGLATAAVVAAAASGPVAALAEPTPTPTGSQSPSPDPTSTSPTPTPTDDDSPSPDPSPTKTSPSPDPTDSATPQPDLVIDIALSSQVVVAGESVAAKVTVKYAASWNPKGKAPDIGVKLSAPGLKVTPERETLGSKGGSFAATVEVPEGTSAGQRLLTVQAKAGDRSRKDWEKITVSTASPTPGSASPSVGSLPPGTVPPTSGLVTATPGLPNAPQVALPPVAAPSVAPTPMTFDEAATLRSATSADPLTDVAAAQAGWLAALLAGNLLLLLRSRLGRRALRAARASATTLNARRVRAAKARTERPAPPPVPAPAARPTRRQRKQRAKHAQRNAPHPV